MNKDYFNRTQLLIGQDGLERLEKSCIVVVGLGGVGSHAVEALARSGVGRIVLVDPDTIAPSNLNRQLPALISTIGQFKTEVLAARLKDINPSLQIAKYSFNYNEENSSLILKGSINFVIDAIDSLHDKIHLIKTCLQRKIPIISSMGTANRLNPQLLCIADIKDTSICPVAKKIRRQLRQENISAGLPVVYSREIPVQVHHSGETRLGSIAFVPATAGLLLASFAVNTILSNKE